MRYPIHAFILILSLACTTGGEGFGPRSNPASPGYEGEETAAAENEATPVEAESPPEATAGAEAETAPTDAVIDGWCSPELITELGAAAAERQPEGEPCALLGSASRRETAYKQHLYTYDDEGRLSASWQCHRNTGCSVTQRRYDDEGRLVERRECMPDRVSYARFEYPAEGRRVTLAPGSLDDEDPTPRQRTQLDEGGRPLVVEHFQEGEWETFMEFDAEYEDGRLVRRSKLFTDNAEVIAYEYDDEGRIASARYWSFRSGVTREAAHAIPEIDPTSTVRFTYDEEGRLSSVDTGGPSGANFSDLGLLDVHTRYLYDPAECAEVRETVRELGPTTRQ